MSDYSNEALLNSAHQKPGKIILMPFNVELSTLGATGLTEVHAKWTQTARRLLQEEITRFLYDKYFDVEKYFYTSHSLESIEVQLDKLNESVAYSIITHELDGSDLPTRNKNSTWTLGDGTLKLKDKSDGDYAVFVYVRDSYSSTQRKALQAMNAIRGVVPTGGSQWAIISLVDLETGEIVWFNRLVSLTGELRDRDSVRKTVAKMFDSFPATRS